MEPLQYEKRGYLNEPFRLFHLADGSHQEIAYHYHTFHKIIILLAGRAGYAIEGEGYALQPGDYVLVGRGSIHRPIVEQGDFYERAILYISPEFLQEQSRGGDDLETCFRQAQRDFRYVYHLTEGLTIDELAARFYISKYHMMRRFRDETGYTIHGYVTEKRLLLAQQLLEQGVPSGEAALRCGYQEYSTFSRAYKKQFGRSPSVK